MNYVYKFICFSIFLISNIHLAQSQCNRNTMISIAGNNPSIELCAGDLDNGTIIFSTSNRGTAYAFVVTDADDNFVSSGVRSRVDFSELAPGVYRVYGISFAGSLRNPVGQNIYDARLSGLCAEISTNFITVSIIELDAGVVSTAGGETQVDLCVGDGLADVVDFTSTSPDIEEYRYIITDDGGRILAIVDTSFADFENAPEGKCRVYGLSGSGMILAQMGDEVGGVNLTDGCEDLTDNYITINRIRTDGGEVSNPDGNDMVFVCPNNGSADVVEFKNTGTAAHGYRYIITDNSGTIIGLPTEPMIDFNEAPPGICRVYGVSFTGDFTAMTDGSVQGTLSSECSSLSTNYITVYREDPIAGTVLSATGDTVTYTCPGDTIADLVDVQVIGGSNSDMVYVITDNDGVILDAADGLPLDLTGAPAGTCRVYVVAFTGRLMVERGVPVSETVFSEDCYDVSDGYLEVRRSRPAGGEVQLIDGTTEIELCVGDGMSDLLTMENNSASLAPYRYVITDDSNKILGLPGADFADFEGAGAGVCRIWGLSYTGSFTAGFGDEVGVIDLSDDCFEVSSNYIEVTRILIDAGRVLTTDGESVIYTCPGDDVDDIVFYESTSNTNAMLTYVITNENNFVLAIVNSTEVNFENVGQGICRVWAIAHTGNIILTGGQDVTAVPLSTGCAALSTGFLEVHRSIPSVGSIATTDGETQVLVCNGDGSDAIINYEVSDRSDADMRYIITDDANNILDITSATQVDFSNAPDGTCRIYALSFTSGLNWRPGDNIDDVAASDDCFDLSDNYIEVVRNGVDGGLVFTEANMSRVFICPGNGISNLIGFTTTSPSIGRYSYIVTDENNVVIGLPGANEVDFDNAPIGTCRLWGVSYSGSVIIDMGQNIILDPISDACFDRSSNFVTVIRDNPNWDELTTSNGATSVDVTVGDGIPDIVTLSRDGNTFGLTAIIITDADGNVLGTSNGVSIDFEGAGEGVCLVYGLAYTGDLLVMEGMNINTDVLSSDCYDLSDNAVTVNRTPAFDNPDGPTSFVYVDADEEDVIISYAHSNALARIQLSAEPTHRGDVYVHSLQGELVWSQTNADRYLEIDLGELDMEQGIYLITYRSEDRIKTQKIFIPE